LYISNQKGDVQHTTYIYIMLLYMNHFRVILKLSTLAVEKVWVLYVYILLTFSVI